MTEPQGAGNTGEQPTETPGYKSPLEQALENLPFGIFRTLAERMGNTKGGGGGQFTFSLDEMTELHRQFTDEVVALENMADEATQAAQNLRPLAADEASTKHYSAAQDHNGKLQGAIAQQREFAVGFRDATLAAIKLKSKDEGAIASEYQKTAGQVQ